jgi:hypothetical protein
MLRVFKIMSWRTKINSAFALVSIIGVFGILHQLQSSQATRDNDVLIYTFGILSLLFVGERITTLLSDIFSDQEASESSRLLNDTIIRLPRILSGDTDIVPFTRAHEALRYCVSAVNSGDVIEVKNIVLRYGVPQTSGLYGDIYADWIESKKSSVSAPIRCVWTEIVSTRLSPDDPQEKFMNEMEDNSPNYRKFYFDDKNIPLPQIILMTFENRPQEVIFGWELPSMRHGRAFLSRNKLLVEHFDSYFKDVVAASYPTKQMAIENAAGVRESTTTGAAMGA